jgi:hypothetical protein
MGMTRKQLEQRLGKALVDNMAKAVEKERARLHAARSKRRAQRPTLDAAQAVDLDREVADLVNRINVLLKKRFGKLLGKLDRKVTIEQCNSVVSVK